LGGSIRIVGVGAGDGDESEGAKGDADDELAGDGIADDVTDACAEGDPITTIGTIDGGVGDEVTFEDGGAGVPLAIGCGCGRTACGIPPEIVAKQHAATNTIAP